MWLIVIAVSGVSAALGYLLLDPTRGLTGAFAQGFAAGALLAMVADTLLPEAYDETTGAVASRHWFAWPAALRALLALDPMLKAP